MDTQALATLFFQELYKLRQQKQLNNMQQLMQLFHLLVLLFQEFSHRDKLPFSSLYARMAYVCQKRNVAKRQQFVWHAFRKQAHQALMQEQLPPDLLVDLGYRVLADAITQLFQHPIPEELEALLPKESVYPQSQKEAIAFRPVMRVLAMGDDESQQQLLVLSDQQPGEEVRVQYGIADRNENFMPSIELLRKAFEFPVSLILLDVEIDKDGILSPRAFVIEPDFLMDATSIAECFKADGIQTAGYLLRKFLPFEAKPPLMLGNMANFFLDELLSEPTQTFQELMARSFSLNPLAFSLYDDSTVMRLKQDAQTHYLTLKKMVLSDFSEQGIDTAQCNLEPSFYSANYGIQGRLDMLHRAADGQRTIIELKSGKLFRPNMYGLNRNHYVQTLLYDLLIRSTYGHAKDPKSYILYSRDTDRPLRFAPVIKAEQYEALQVRNHLMAYEQQLANLKDFHEQWPWLFRRLRGLPLRGFMKRDLDEFLKVIDSLRPIEMQYFCAFSGFIAREHRLAKLGAAHGAGQSALWLSSLADKKQQFGILDGLELVEDASQAEIPRLYFKKPGDDSTTAKFRKGDIGILYPSKRHAERLSPLSDQVFKCSVESINAESVCVQLRARQFDRSMLQAVERWSIEQDLFDGSYNGLYQQLFAFMKAAPAKRDLWLSKIAPRKPIDAVPLDPPAELTVEQQNVFSAIIASQDYYLLWGPPGTGKTSRMLRYLTAHWYKHTQQSILLLAYTNKAVDEICDALTAIDSELEYIRIGSHLGCGEAYRHKLLQEQTSGLTRRKELRRFLDRHRIYVATVSSLHSKQELLRIKAFDRVIIDEASQLLEPMLLGLLPRFKHTLLIGDHRQLPAVVQQPAEDTLIHNPALRTLELTDMRDSLFERLYRRAQAEDWHWAYGQLSQQGRMHEDIMQFPNEQFYDGQLHILPASIAASALQNVVWESQKFSDQPIAARVSFVPVSGQQEMGSAKVSVAEAKILTEWVQRLHARLGDAFHADSLGIISPYRAQIVQIRERLAAAGLPVELITIDTVERFQGGARDVIMISLCTNSQWQLERMVSLSSEGIDRKFNVALTRARKQLVVFGDPVLLQQQAVYRAFVERYTV